jgi:phenylalanyl-tRNA synthetase beta chain
VITSPDLTPREMEIDLPSARHWLGIPLDADSLMLSLSRMRLAVEPLEGRDDHFRVRYPAFRTDIRHMVDVFEDLAIGYGYSNIEPQLVPTMTVGHSRSEEKVSETVRSVLLGLGLSEVMNLTLTTEEDHFQRLCLPTPESYPEIAKSNLKALTVVRTHMMTGLLKSLHENHHRSLPLQLFEIDNVVLLDQSGETGTREERRVAFVQMGPEAGYASVRAVLDALLRELGLTGVYSAKDHPSFTPGRCAAVSAGQEIHGLLGELYTEVITNFGLDHPVALAELTLCRVI